MVSNATDAYIDQAASLEGKCQFVKFLLNLSACITNV